MIASKSYLPQNYLSIKLIFGILFWIYSLIITYYRIKHINYLLKSDELDIKIKP
jgi:hypothetical protein